ncbi:murein transglycosylase [Microbacterium sp. P04]|uniref:murein transglycosylase n=1 Tax=Microbacterium sp. P04 TaxID=3366947 RepID=UPI003746B0A7
MPKPAPLVSEPMPGGAPPAASITTIGDVVDEVSAIQPGPDQEWVLRTGAATSIPVRALEGYATAAFLISNAQPDCHLGWNTLAAIGAVETGHAGGALTDEGIAEPAIIGVPLDGSNGPQEPDTDRGGYDSDTAWDRVVGPLQFTPAAWSSFGVDADGDGAANPQDIDDAALTAAFRLCQYGDLATTEGWDSALHAYNPSNDYIEAVRGRAAEYAASAD